MTCEKFREQLNFLLDKSSVQSLSKEMQNHKNLCKECDRYTTSINSVHEQLFLIQRVKPSETLMNQLLSIGAKTQMMPLLPSWKYDIRRALIYLSPLALIFLSNNLPVLAGSLINFGILTAGLVYLLTTVLKPLFFARY